MLNIEDDDTVPVADASSPPPSPDGPTRVTRALECTLSDAELRERGEEMARCEREIDGLKDRRKSLNMQIRGRLDRMTVCAKAIDSRRETRDVWCTWRPDYPRNIWELTRDGDATGKVIDSRAMSSVDRQTKLPIDSAPRMAAANDVDDDEGDPAYLDDDPADDLLAPADTALDDLLPVDLVPVGPQHAGELHMRITPAKRARKVTRGGTIKPATKLKPVKPVKPVKRARGR